MLNNTTADLNASDRQSPFVDAEGGTVAVQDVNQVNSKKWGWLCGDKLAYRGQWGFRARRDLILLITFWVIFRIY